MSNTINSLNAIYNQQIAEDEDRMAITPEDAAAVGQHVRAIKYDARKSGEPLPRAYNTYVSKNNLTATQRRITKEKLGLAEDTSMPHISKNDQSAIKTRAKGLFKKDLKGTVSGVNETLSNWRESFELREIDMPSTGLHKKKRPRTSEKSRREITDKPSINNKVVINPTMNQLVNSFEVEIEKMGGMLLEVAEVKEAITDQVPLDKNELTIQRRMANLNIRLARKNREKLNKIKPEEKKVEEGIGRAAIGAGVGAIVGGPVGAAAGAALGASMGKKKVTGTVQKKKPVDIADPHGNVAKAKKKVVGESRDSAGGDLDKEPPSWASMNPQDRGNPAYMKTSSLKDEEKWKRLQKMRKASKKKEVRAKANEEVVHESGWHRRNPEKVGTSADPDFNVLKGKGKPVKDSKPATTGKASKQPPGIYKPNKEGKFVKVDEEKKPLPKVKMYRKAGNLGREALSGSETGKERSKKIIRVLNKHTADGYKKAALDKLRDGSSPKHQTEDKAFANVVAALKKKHGDAGVLSSKKDFDDHKKREASKPTAKQIQKKDERTAAQREVDAQYGRTPWNKKGSLGT